MGTMQLTEQQARRFLLLKQGLIGVHKFGGEQGICDFIEQAGCIQFDPIDVCGKNAELVLQARVQGFTKDMLYKLLYADRKLVDYFDKNMSIIRLDDWKYFSRKRAAYVESNRDNEQMKKAVENVKHIIQEKGYVSAREISLRDKVQWAWSATTLARAALETLYFQGELILHHKNGTIKHYALAHDHIPKKVLEAHDPNETDEQHKQWWILRRIGAVGLMWNRPSDAWLGIDGLKAPERKRIFEKLQADKKISEILIEGVPENLYCLTEDLFLLEELLSNKEFPSRTEFIAPLDNLLWDRKLISRLFNFNYKWEIYTPAHQRKFGYYALPILHGDRFIGRIEAVKDAKKRVLLIRNIWLERGVESKLVENDLWNCIERFKVFNQCNDLQCEPGVWKGL